MRIIQVLKNEFRDSLFLLKMSNDVSGWEGVKQAVVVMGTANNRRILQQVGLLESAAAEATADDLVIAVEVESDVAEAEIIARLKERLAKVSNRKISGTAYYTLGSALKSLPESNMVSVSIPGKYAADLVREALEADKHVFCFSQHVTVDDELELKKLARSKDLLIMGPDCGTAIIDGYGMGFANKIRRGSIGLVSASGSGLQEVTTLIHKAGGGITQAIGVGGRDLDSPMDGIMAEAAVRLLVADPETKVLVILAKKALPSAQERVLAAARASGLPVVADFGLTRDTVQAEKNDTVIVKSYEECAREALRLAGLTWRIPSARKEFEKWLSARPKRLGKTVRGLYAGGSLCGEAVGICQRSGIELVSNLNEPLENYQEAAHVFLDLGAEEYTEGRAHPFIDYRLRVLELKKAFTNPQVGVILMDVVLGWGSNEDPAGELVRGIEAARREYGRGPDLVASIVGTEEDFQKAGQQKARLAAAGVFIAESNAAAVAYALEIIGEKRG